MKSCAFGRSGSSTRRAGCAVTRAYGFLETGRVCPRRRGSRLRAGSLSRSGASARRRSERQRGRPLARRGRSGIRGRCGRSARWRDERAEAATGRRPKIDLRWTVSTSKRTAIDARADQQDGERREERQDRDLRSHELLLAHRGDADEGGRDGGARARGAPVHARDGAQARPRHGRVRRGRSARVALLAHHGRPQIQGRSIAEGPGEDRGVRGIDRRTHAQRVHRDPEGGDGPVERERGRAALVRGRGLLLVARVPPREEARARGAHRLAGLGSRAGGRLRRPDQALLLQGRGAHEAEDRGRAERAARSRGRPLRARGRSVRRLQAFPRAGAGQARHRREDRAEAPRQVQDGEGRDRSSARPGGGQEARGGVQAAHRGAPHERWHGGSDPGPALRHDPHGRPTPRRHRSR